MNKRYNPKTHVHQFSRGGKLKTIAAIVKEFFASKKNKNPETDEQANARMVAEWIKSGDQEKFDLAAAAYTLRERGEFPFPHALFDTLLYEGASEDDRETLKARLEDVKFNSTFRMSEAVARDLLESGGIIKKHAVARVRKSKQEKVKTFGYRIGWLIAIWCHVAVGFFRLVRTLLIVIGVLIAIVVVLVYFLMKFVWHKFSAGFKDTQEIIAMQVYQLMMKPNCAICHKGKTKKELIVFDSETKQFTHPDCLWAQDLANIISAGYYDEAAAFLKLSREEKTSVNIRFPLDTVGLLLYETYKSPDTADELIRHVEALASQMSIEEASRIVEDSDLN